MNVQLLESIKQLIQALPQEEQTWLKAQFSAENNNASGQVVDLNSFSGTIQLRQDPLEFQRQIRDEWA
jgi:ABC-type transporter Mla subunit MlaD